MSERQDIDIGAELQVVYAWLEQVTMEGTPDERRAAQTARHAMNYLRTPPEVEIRIEKRPPFKPYGSAGVSGSE